jgi:integrase
MNKPYKLCSCRGPTTVGPDGRKRLGKLLGKSCPKLKTDSRHDSWFARYEAPRAPGEPRRQPRIGPYPTEKEAARALTKAVGEVDAGMHASDRKLTVAAYLGRWLEDMRPGLKPRTWASYEEAVRLYFGPGLGHIRLADLRDEHIRALYASMRKINRPEAEASNDEMLRRLLAARRTIPHLPRQLWGTKPVGEAGIKRRHVVLVAAMNDAVERRLIAVNPASAIKFKLRKQRPLLWTEPRVKRWHETGRRPAVSMVWSPSMAGQFLDSIEGDRLYPLYHLAIYYGLRRSELIGLEWADLDLKARRLHVRQAQTAGTLDSTKSEDSTRIITIDPGTAGVLKAWRDRQSFEALEWGEAWQDSGRVFTKQDGTPLRAPFVSEHFEVLYRQVGLPPVRFHDARHGAGSMLLAAGQPPKVVSEILGHSTVAFTMDVYAVVLEELAEAAATAIADFIPRKARTEAAL